MAVRSTPNSSVLSDPSLAFRSALRSSQILLASPCSVSTMFMSLARGGIKIDAVFPRYLRNTGGRDDAPDMTKRTIAGPRTVTVGLYLI